MAMMEKAGQWFGNVLEHFMPDVDQVTVKGTPEAMIKRAGWDTFGVTAVASMPGGAVGYAAIIPELITITRMQMALVASIAKYYGKERMLSREVMLLVFASEAGIYLGREVLEKAGAQVVVRLLTTRVIRELAEKVGARITQRAATRLATRWVPVLMAPAFGQFTRAMTERIGREAIKLFSEEVTIEQAADTAA